MSVNVNVSGDDDNVKKQVCQFTPEEIEEIRRKDPNAEILKVTYDKVDRIKPMSEVKVALSAIRGLFEQFRRDEPGLSDADVRSKIREKMPVADEMARLTHPKLFQAMTSRESTEKDFQMILFNIELREQVERGEMTEEESMVALYTRLIEIKKDEMEEE